MPYGVGGLELLVTCGDQGPLVITKSGGRFSTAWYKYWTSIGKLAAYFISTHPFTYAMGPTDS